MHACRARARQRPPTPHCAKLWCASRPIFEWCSRPQLQQPCAKTAWIGSTRPHPPRARRFFCRAASAPEGSAKIRATRRAQDRRSPLTVKRTRAGAPPTPQRAIAALAQRPARHGRAQRPRKSGSPAGTRRHRVLCLGAGRRRPRATTPCRSACPPIAHGPPQNFVLFSQDNVTFDPTSPFSSCLETTASWSITMMPCLCTHG